MLPEKNDLSVHETVLKFIIHQTNSKNFEEFKLQVHGTAELKGLVSSLFHGRRGGFLNPPLFLLLSIYFFCAGEHWAWVGG